MQVRRVRPPDRGAVLSAVLGLAVLPSLIPGGLGAGLPIWPAADEIVDGPAATGRLLLVRHAGTAPVVVVDTTRLTGPALRGWWVDGVTGETVDVGSVPSGPAVALRPPDTGDAGVRDWTLVIVDATRGLVPPA
jgi:hypothetical protein